MVDPIKDKPAHRHIYKHTHLGVYAVVEAVIENESKVILVRKGRGPYRGAWDLPGGKIEWGEAPMNALQREVEEETGLHIGQAILRAALSHRMEWTRADGETEALHHLGLIYDVSLQAVDTPLKQDPDGQDSDGALWHDKNRVPDLQLTPFARAAFTAK